MKTILLLLCTLAFTACHKTNPDELMPVKHSRQYKLVKVDNFASGVYQNTVYDYSPASQSIYLTVKADTIERLSTPVQGQTNPTYNVVTPPQVNDIIFAGQNPTLQFSGNMLITTTTENKIYWTESNYTVNQ